MASRAFIVLHGGPLDGAEINWPKSAGEFPAAIQFGFYDNDGSDPIYDPKGITHHRYTIIRGWAIGPLDPADGLPRSEHQEYRYTQRSQERIPSVAELW